MKIFPKSYYSLELDNDSVVAFSKLKKQTLSKGQFVANWNNQTFIGEIKKNEFEIQLSKKLFGEFCILNGKLEDRNGTLEIRTGKIYKIIFVAIVLFVLSGLVVSIIQNKLEFIFQFILTILIMRFVFIELGFRLISKIALKKLTEVIEIKKISVA